MPQKCWYYVALTCDACIHIMIVCNSVYEPFNGSGLRQYLQGKSLMEAYNKQVITIHMSDYHSVSSLQNSITRLGGLLIL